MPARSTTSAPRRRDSTIREWMKMPPKVVGRKGKALRW